VGAKKSSPEIHMCTVQGDNNDDVSKCRLSKAHLFVRQKKLYQTVINIEDKLIIIEDKLISTDDKLNSFDKQKKLISIDDKLNTRTSFDNKQKNL
jgi:hypothetical protein